MKYYCTLSPHFSKTEKYAQHWSSIISTFPEEYPLLYQFVNEQDKFMRKHFGALTDKIIREKRLLEFENPNRAHISYEYDICDFDIDKEQDIIYLFTPVTRLNWLKIFIDGERCSIAESSRIKTKIRAILGQELKILENKFHIKNIYDQIWRELNPIPCFIINNHLELKTTFLIEVSFYQSVMHVKKEPLGFLNFIDKRIIEYNYIPSTDKTSWLYIMIPSKSDVRVCYNDSEIRKVYSDKDEDTHIVSYIIKTEAPLSNHFFTIEINVTKSLRIWFNALAVLIIALLISYLICFFLKIPLIENNNERIAEVLLAVTMSVIAMILTTRGWLINEDSTMKRYSNFLTFSMLILFMMLLLGVFLI